VDASIDYLIHRVYKSPDTLLDARNLLGGREAQDFALPCGTPGPLPGRTRAAPALTPSNLAAALPECR